MFVVITTVVVNTTKGFVKKLSVTYLTNKRGKDIKELNYLEKEFN